MIKDAVLRFEYRLSQLGVLPPWSTALPGANTKPSQAKRVQATCASMTRQQRDPTQAQVFFNDNLHLSLTHISPLFNQSIRSCKAMINHCVNYDTRQRFEQSLAATLQDCAALEPTSMLHVAPSSANVGARKVPSTSGCTSVNLGASGQEDWTHRQRLSEKPFPGSIGDESRENSVRAADAEYSIVDVTNKLVLWTDGSVFESKTGVGDWRSGIGVVWKMNHTLGGWEERSYSLLGKFSSNTVEFFAVSEAFKIALQLCRAATAQSMSQDDVRVSGVTVYTDSRYVVQILGNSPLTNTWKYGTGADLMRLTECAYKLQELGVKVEVRWVKGHAGVEGNVRADQLAYRAARIYRNAVEDYMNIERGTVNGDFRTKCTPTERACRRPTALINAQRAAFEARFNKAQIEQRLKLRLKAGIEKRYEHQKKTMGETVLSKLKLFLALQDPSKGPAMHLIRTDDR